MLPPLVAHAEGPAEDAASRRYQMVAFTPCNELCRGRSAGPRFVRDIIDDVISEFVDGQGFMPLNCPHKDIHGDSLGRGVRSFELKGRYCDAWAGLRGH